MYVLPVEGGLSRFLAVFSSRFPPAIGPVRSAREDDLELLRQFGRPAFAYSGAQQSCCRWWSGPGSWTSTAAAAASIESMTHERTNLHL